MAGPIRKEGSFTDTVRGNREGMADVWDGMRNQEWFDAPGATQHHDRVLRRERMGQKKTPPGKVVMGGAHLRGTPKGGSSAAAFANRIVKRK
jgi:hypothetical protein